MPANPDHPDWMSWTATATAFEFEVAIQRAAYAAVTQFCEQHLDVTDGTRAALLPIRHQLEPEWRRRMEEVTDLTQPDYSSCLVATVQYAQHTSYLISEANTEAFFLRSYLGEARDEAAAARARVTTLERQLGQANVRADGLSDEVDILTGNLQDRTQELEQTQAQLAHAQEQIEDLQHELHEMQIDEDEDEPQDPGPDQDDTSDVDFEDAPPVGLPRAEVPPAGPPAERLVMFQVEPQDQAAFVERLRRLGFAPDVLQFHPPAGGNA